MGQPGLFSFIYSLLKQTVQICATNQCKKRHVHPVYSTRIRTQDLLNMSRHP